MRLAVLMSTYNGERYLVDQIESILEQKTDFEYSLIVRDDGSTDKTCDILKQYAAENKILFVKGENIGAAKGFMSLLIDNPGYDYYAFSDQDDIWNENKLQIGVDSIRAFSGPALYCSNCELVDSELNSIGRNTHRKRPTYSLESILCLASCAQGCTSVFNLALAKILQKYPLPETFIMHDSLITCLCGLINGTIIYDENPSMKYRMHDKNVFGMVSAKQNKMRVIKSRLKEIATKKKISMYDQAESILNTYRDLISDRSQALCEIVVKSKKSIIARLKLVFSKNLKHDTLNKTITKKLEILFGND